MIKSRSLFAAVAAGTILFAGCSAGSTDYKKAAEKAINESSQFEKGSGTCVKPDSTDVGTTFDCTGIPAGTTDPIQLTATIDKKGHVIVGLPVDDSTATSAADDGSGTETTVADDSTTETTEA